MASNTAVISVRDLSVGFGETPVLDRASLDVFEGEILGFVGDSGAGKSVLMRTIIGLLPKRGGSIEVFGAGACCSSRAHCSPRSPRCKTSSFRSANISSSRRA
jgi:ABC-type transporter Mla maintaining outer membrane lipid asymmetry ATPase subunit MlaF